VVSGEKGPAQTTPAAPTLPMTGAPAPAVTPPAAEPARSTPAASPTPADKGKTPEPAKSAAETKKPGRGGLEANN
jgi:hypothetical protein